MLKKIGFQQNYVKANGVSGKLCKKYLQFQENYCKTIGVSKKLNQFEFKENAKHANTK